MAKKPPTFGQHPYDPAKEVPPSQWEPIYDNTDLLNYDGVIEAGNSSRDAVAHAQQFLFPQQVSALVDWAVHNPTTDPRTYYPLAVGQINPSSATGAAISAGAIASQVDNGTHGAAIGSNQPVSPSGTWSSKSSPFGDTPVVAQAAPAAAQQGNQDTPLVSFMNGVNNVVQNAWGSVTGGLETAARGVQYGLQSGWDALQGTARTGTGLNEKQQAIAKQMGLSDEEAALAFPVNPVTQALAGKDIQGTAPSTDGKETGGLMAGLTHKGLYTTNTSASWDDMTDDQKAKIKAAQDAYAKIAPDAAALGSQIAAQTPLGQIAKNPALLTQDSGWLAQNQAVVTGTTDPTTGKPLVNPTTGKPYEVQSEGTDKASLKAYDMRTADEIARGVAPVGWTPGRGVAHNVAAPDTQAFNTLSGIIDFGSNLTLDPANAIPINALPKGVKALGKGASYVISDMLGGDASHIPGAIGRAMERGGKQVGVQVPQGAAFQGARETARGKAALTTVDTAGNVAYREPDVSLLERNGVKVDTNTGLVTSPHGNIVMPQSAWEFLNSGRGKALVDDIVNAKSASEIWLRSNRKMDLSLAKQLADASTPEQVRSIIGTRMGFDLNDPASLRNFGSSAPGIFKNMALKDNPVLGYLRKAPQAKPFDLEDSDNTITQLERFARGARMNWGQVQPHLDNVIAAAGNNEQTYQAIYGGERLLADGKTVEKIPGFLDTVAQHLSDTAGLSLTDAKQVTTAFKGGLDESLRNFVNAGLPDAMGSSVDGMIGSAMLDSELLTRAAVLPDYRTVREVSGAIGRIRTQMFGRNSKDIDRAVSDVINSATSAWKSTVLVRPAYVAREVGEMAVASALGGYESVLTHPGAFVGLVLSTLAQKEASTAAGRVARALTGTLPAEHLLNLEEKAVSGGRLAKVGTQFRSDAYYAASLPAALANMLHINNGMRLLFPALDQRWARVNGDGLYDALNHAATTGDTSGIEKAYYGMGAVAGNFNIDERGMGRMASRSVKIASQDPKFRTDYTNGLIDRLRALAADGDMRNLANPGVDFRTAVKDFQMSGRRDRKVTAGAKNFAGKSDEEYMQDLNDVLQKLTGGDPQLLEAIARGTFAGGQIGKSNKSLVGHIGSLLDNPEMAQSLPATMRYNAIPYDNVLSQKFRDATTRFFDNTAESSDILMRGPMYRQAYANRVQDLAADMTPAAHAEAVAKLRKAGDAELANRLRTAIPQGTLTSYEVDHLAMQHALNETKRIFYDAHERQNYAVALRAVMPFAQATFNTIRRWGELSMRNPQLMYRTLKPLNYAMSPGSASIYGALGSLYGDPSQALYDPTSYGYSTPDTQHASVDGFFYTDNYGDKKFSYPLIGAIGQWAGIPQGAMNESSVSGLNVAGTSIQPGFGPAVTFAASIFGQEAINRDDAVGDAMRFLFPYAPPTGSVADKLMASFSPSWANKIAKATDDQNTVPNLAVKVQGVLLSGGGYDLSSSVDQKRLAVDSSALATRLYWWNALMGTMTPATINTKPVVKATTAQGDFQVAQTQTGYSPSDQGKMVDAILAADPTDSKFAARRWIIQDKLKQEWEKYTAGTGSLDAYRNGMLHFVHDYGKTALFSVLPSTQGADNVSPNQATNDVWHFRTTQPDAYTQNQNVIGLFFAGGSAFVPGDKSPTGYSSPLYSAQKAAGEREQKPADQYVKDAMNEWGWMLYNPKKLEIEQNPSLTADQKSAAKDGLTKDIQELTNGAWTGQPVDSGKTTMLMQQLRTATNDPTVQTLASAPYLKEYMDYRDELLAQMKNKGVVGNFTNKANLPYAIQLINKAKELISADPTGAFNNAWNRLLINEFGSA